MVGMVRMVGMVVITRSTVTLNFLLATLKKVKKKLVMSMS